MDSRFETFTLLITRISRSIKRIKAEEMAAFGLKGPHVSCLYYLYRCGPMTAAAAWAAESAGVTACRGAGVAAVDGKAGTAISSPKSRLLNFMLLLCF